MDDLVIDTQLENIDRRLTKLEQILPTLITKSDMQEVRRHMDVIGEALRADIRLLAEHVASALPGSRND